MKPEVRLETGGTEIIASGIGMTLSGEASFDIYLKFAEDFSFMVRFIFIDNEDGSQPALKRETDADKNIIKLTCTNFADFIGTGTLKPLELGTYGGRLIYLHFWVRTPEEKKMREVRYCFYLEKEGQE